MSIAANGWRMFWVRINSRLSRELVLVALGQILAALGTIVGLRVLTGLLNPRQFGEYALGLTISSLVGMLASGPGLAATRFFAHAVECHQFHSFFRASWWVLLKRIKIIGYVIAGLFVVTWLSGNAKWINMIVATVMASLGIAFSSILDGIQSAARQRAVVALHSGLTQWLRFIIAFALIQFFGSSSTAAMYGYFFAVVCVLISQVLFFRRFKRRNLGPDQQPVVLTEVQSWEKLLNSYAWPVALYGGFDWINMSAGRWSLQLFVDTKAVGFHSALSQIGSGPMVLASNLVTQLFGPILFSRAGDGVDYTRRYKAHKLNINILLLFILFSGLAVIVAYLFHEVVFMIFVSSEYRVVSCLLPLVVISGALSACGNIALFFILSSSETKSLVRPKALIMCVGVFCSFFGAYWHGLVGIIWAGVITSFFYLVAILYVSFLKFRKRAPATP